MRLVAGCILILTAAVLISAYWIGKVQHNSVIAGSPEALYFPAATVFLGLFGGALAGIGLFSDRMRDGMR